MRRRSDLGVLAIVLSAAFGSASEAQELTIEPITDQTVNSPKEELRLKLFSDKDKVGCVPVKSDPRGATGLDPSLDKFLKQVIQALKSRDGVALQPLFHERMNVKMAALDENFARQNSFYGTAIDVSIYRLWALNTVDGTPGMIPCPGAQLSLLSFYGYPLQFGAWLQIMGKEIGRVYVSIVPANGKWNLGSFHAQQWTHASKDAKAWMDDGDLAMAQGHKEAAYVFYDLATKLLDGDRFVEIDSHQEALRLRDSTMTTDAWTQMVKTTLKDFDVINTTTLFVEGGAGVLSRVRIKEEISLENLKAQCKQMAQSIMAKPWSAQLAGIRCSFNLPKEDPAKEGVSGGMYLSFADAKKK